MFSSISPLQIKLNERSPKNYLGWLSANKAGVCSTASDGPPQLGGHALVGDLGLLSMADGVKDLSDSQTCFTHLNDLDANPPIWTEAENNSKEQHKLIQGGSAQTCRVGGPLGQRRPFSEIS